MGGVASVIFNLLVKLDLLYSSYLILISKAYLSWLTKVLTLPSLDLFYLQTSSYYLRSTKWMTLPPQEFNFRSLPSDYNDGEADGVTFSRWDS